MKKAGLIGIILLLTGVIVYFLLLPKASDNTQLVKFKGAESVTNLTKGHFDWMSSVKQAGKINAIPARPNDLIYCVNPEGSEVALMIQNRQQRDEILNVRFDSLGAYVNDKLATLVVKQNDKAVSHWVSTSTKEDFGQLQSVLINDSLSENTFQELKEIGKSTSGIGLIIDSDTSYFYKLQEALNPSWLWLGNVTVSPEMVKLWNKSDKLDNLTLTEVNMNQVSLDSLKNIKTLHIDNPDSITLLQLNRLPKGLLSLQISNSDLRDLHLLRGHSKLDEVIINHCALLRDISSLAKFPHLKTLSLADCDSISDLEPIMELKELTWFAPPKNISEQQLAAILNNSPNMESLVLEGCYNIKNLDMLKHSRRLSCLTLISTPVMADSLAHFKNLKYLAYGQRDSKDSLSIAQLQKEMPNTLVTAAEPFCLSTGWLIVFFVLLILLTLMAIKVKNKVSV